MTSDVAVRTKARTSRRTAQGAALRDWGPTALVTVVVAVVIMATPSVSDLRIDGDAAGYTSATWPASMLYVVALALTLGGVLVGRRSPARGTLLTLAPFVLVAIASDDQPVWGWWLGVVAVAFLAALDGWRRAVLPFVVAAALAFWFCWDESIYVAVPTGATNAGGGHSMFTFVLYLAVMLVFVAAAAVAGASRRSWARRAAAEVLEEHALEVESVAGERARLARDLHDVVAHHVSLVAVRAESAPFVHPGLGEDARTVLAAIATDAREALTELRQVLVVLQRTQQAGDRRPQPTACDVDQLVAAAVAAGQPVELEGTWTDVGPAVGYVLYRAVQEGLTNARRHAPGAATHLRRTQSGASVGFTLSNPADRAEAPGSGLIGMRERVESLGGTLEARIVDHAFVVDVALPVTA